MPSHAFHMVALKSLSRVLLSHGLGHYSLLDRDVSIKHVHIKQEWACRTYRCVKKVINYRWSAVVMMKRKKFFERFSRALGCGN